MISCELFMALLLEPKKKGVKNRKREENVFLIPVIALIVEALVLFIKVVVSVFTIEAGSLLKWVGLGKVGSQLVVANIISKRESREEKWLFFQLVFYGNWSHLFMSFGETCNYNECCCTFWVSYRVKGDVFRIMSDPANLIGGEDAGEGQN